MVRQAHQPPAMTPRGVGVWFGVGNAYTRLGWARWPWPTWGRGVVRQAHQPPAMTSRGVGVWFGTGNSCTRPGWARWPWPTSGLRLQRAD